MSQCLRCSKLCEANAVFCEECRSLLRNQLQQRPSPHASQEEPSSSASPLADVPTLAEHGAIQGNPLERITSPLPVGRANQEPQPVALVAPEDLVDQAVYRLNEAAQLIAEEEEQGKSDRKARPYSRAPRLRPIPDISADIRRESTPLPQISGTPQSEPVSRNGLEHQLDNGISPVRLDAHASLPDLWPWLDADTEDKENDIWADRTDPLIARHFPNSAESARIEEEDIRRALAEGVSTAPHPIPRKSRASHMRIAFIALAIFALVAFAIDGILIGVAFNQPRHAANTQGGLPTLTLSPNVAPIGTTTIRLAIKNFTPSTSVALTHDIQEPIHLDGGSSIITVGPAGSATAGSANVAVNIDSEWETGFHLIVAEDLKTRYTASATLLIMGNGPTPPPHLQLDNRPLDVGAAVVGANSIRPFKLANSGGGSITWSASSKQAWLLVSPSQGTFSAGQTISIAVQRVGLKPGDYKGDLAISSNVSPTQHVEVDMSVLRLTPGPVLALSPALLSFSANDGQSNPAAQTLTISNPGTRTLYWSLANQDQATATAQLSLLRALGPAGNWLSASPLLGVVAPGTTAAIQVVVRSQSMLPGTYTGTLLFTAQGAIDSPQAVNVSLTVFPHCGIVTSSGFLSFTAVQGQSTLGTQALSLNATVSCSGAAINWKSSGIPSWLAVTPASGQLKGTTSAVVSVSVNTAGLSPNTYSGQISFVTGMSTQTVIVRLVVQPPPPPAEPVMGASPLSLNFSNTQGLPNPTGQVVTITNTGGSPLKWSKNIVFLLPAWLSTTPTGGTIAPGQTGQVTITVNTSKLTPGTYAGQITLNGLDTSGNAAPGSPQTVTVNLVVQPPCAITQPSSSALSFSAVQGAANPTQQTVTFTGTGSCVWPVTWSTSVSSAASWLTVTKTNSITGTGQSGSIAVAVYIAGLSAGTYQRTVSISATDASGATAQGSPQQFTLTLTILPPCTLSSPSQASLAFTVAQGQTATAQPVAVSETGTCARPVSWTATGDAASSSWLVLAAASGTDTGTLSVGATSASLLPGTYTGTITLAATDSTGAAVVGSPQTIAVTLTVTGFTVSGSVVVCSPAPSCTTSQPLPGATVTLTSGSTTVATVTADAAGNYSFANVALGSYTLSASGTDSGGTHTGSAAVTVQGDMPNVTIQTF